MFHDCLARSERKPRNLHDHRFFDNNLRDLTRTTYRHTHTTRPRVSRTITYIHTHPTQTQPRQSTSPENPNPSPPRDPTSSASTTSSANSSPPAPSTPFTSTTTFASLARADLSSNDSGSLFAPIPRFWKTKTGFWNRWRRN